MKLKRLLSLIMVLVMAVTTLAPMESIALDSDVATMSLLPLEEKKAYLVLNDYSEEEIKNMPLSDILNMLMDKDGNYISIDSNAKVVWTRFKDKTGAIIRDEYHEISRNETVDLSDFEYSTGYVMELIVGDGKQLNPNNVRYIVRTYITTKLTERTEYEIYKEDEYGNRQKVIPSKEKNIGTTLNGIRSTATVYTVPDHVDGTEYYLNVTSIADEHPNMIVDIYTFSEFLNYYIGYLSGEEAGVAITGQILNKDMTIKGSGYKTILDYTTNTSDAIDHNMYVWTLKDRKTGYLYSYNTFAIYVAQSFLEFNANAYTYENDNMEDVVFYRASLADIRQWGIADDGNVLGYGAEQLCLVLKEGYTSDIDYYVTLNLDGIEYGDSSESHVVKVVEGLYNSLEDIENLPNIKEQFFPEDLNSKPYGYKISWDSESYGMYIYLTVLLDDGTVVPIEIILLNYMESLAHKMIDYFAAPVVGAQDPWFRVDGVKQYGEILDTYVVENGKAINMDTLYGYGYQTLLINDKDVDLSAVQPSFWFGDAERVETYDSVNGNKQISGESVRDFSNGTVQYSTIIDNNVKNYQVNLVKKETGSKLYVNGPNEREVFLDEYFEYKHDILIANVGDQPLTGLEVKLDAENVKLDDYWTIGGENNNTLDAFETTKSNKEYGELANIAKIRLLPDGEGDIDGTLTISADGQDDVVIHLTGRASNPEIVTKHLDDAVKYVPYSNIVATNNMNDWNEVTFSIVKGALPDGLDLNEKTGEIYGAPTVYNEESEEFNFTVKAEYSRDDYFEPSYADLTIKVKDNTNDNVFYASDDYDKGENGYGIKAPLGTDEDGDHGYDVDLDAEEFSFTSYGSFDEFRELWLNGEKLQIVDEEHPDGDYTAEEGSTRVTINSQTFKEKVKQNGANTVAIEFRDGEDLKRTAENFEVNTNNDNDSNSDNNSNGDKNDTQTNTVTFIAHLVDADGKAISGKTIEMHSDVKTGVTDKNGYARFSGLEMDSHTVYIKDKNGKTEAEKSFNIVSGSKISLNGDTITASPGDTFTVTMMLNDATLTFTDIDEGDTSKGNHNDKEDGNNSNPSNDSNSQSDNSNTSNGNNSQSTNNNGTAQSNRGGDDTPSPATGKDIGYTLMIVSLFGLLCTMLHEKKAKVKE